jgi:hypothetical protein
LEAGLRYVAAHSERVVKIILMGTPLGVGLSDGFRQEFAGFCAHWPPIIEAQRDGTLDLDSLSPDDREFLHAFHVPAMLAWGRAMLDWPAVEPADFLCPTLWLVGSEDRVALASVRAYEQSLPGTRVQSHIVTGLTHAQVSMRLTRFSSRCWPSLNPGSLPLTNSRPAARARISDGSAATLEALSGSVPIGYMLLSTHRVKLRRSRVIARVTADDRAGAQRKCRPA